MKKLYFLAFLFFSLPFLIKADMLYLWLENDDFSEMDLLASEDATFKAYANYDGAKTELNVSVARGNGYWKYNSETKQYDYVKDPLTPADFGHKSDNYGANGEYKTVYAIDTGSYTINKNDSSEYVFALELDWYNDTHYSAEILESEIWDKDDRWMWPYKDHMCTGVHLNEYSVPEPNSLMLLIVGGSLLALKRRKTA